MRAAEGGRESDLARNHGLRKLLVHGVIVIAAKLRLARKLRVAAILRLPTSVRFAGGPNSPPNTPQPQHVDHCLPKPRREPVEQLKQNRVVGRGHNAAVKCGIGVDVILEDRAPVGAIPQCAPDRADICRGSSFRGERRRLGLNRCTSLDHSHDVGSPEHGVPIIGSIERGDEHPAP